jgi:zinc transporter ZupT
MNTIISITVVAFLPMVIVMLLPKSKNFFENKFVRGFGLGAYIALVIILLKEVGEHSPKDAITWYVVGIVLSLIIGLIFKHHHHQSDDEGHLNHSSKDIIRILGSDIFHNIVDGVVIIAGFTISKHAGFVAMVGILLHQTLQQVGQQVLLVDHGVKPKKAIWYSFLISLTVFIGLFIPISHKMEHVFMALSAGIVTITIFEDLKNKFNKNISLGLLSGFVLMWAIISMVPHVHSHEEEHENNELTSIQEEHNHENDGGHKEIHEVLEGKDKTLY